jgi:hypothetical protein
MKGGKQKVKGEKRITEVISKAGFPAITLDSDNSFCVTWTNGDTFSIQGKQHRLPLLFLGQRI